MADRKLGRRLRHLANVLRGERDVTTAATGALDVLRDYIRTALVHNHMDPATLDSRAPVWQRAVRTDLLPAVEHLFVSAFNATASGVEVDAAPYAVRHLEAVWNRLVGVADTAFDTVRMELAAGHELQESIPELAARVDTLLSDTQRWRNRAVTIARTEVIGANNAGGLQAAGAIARNAGHGPGQVVKEWLATHDSRTRPTHADADGQQVTGLSTPFSVGDGLLDFAGDPSGPAEEVINCRCTVLYHHPGDSDYPSVAASASVAHPQEVPMTITAAPGDTDPGTDPGEATEAQNGVVVVALPAAADPCVPIGEEQKHTTILYFGDVPVDGAGNPNPGLTDDFRTLLTGLVESTAASTPSAVEPVTGVESLGDDGARVWMLDGSALTAIRDALLTGPDVPPVLAGVEQYPSYTPHVTIGYPPTAPADAEDVTDDDAPDTTEGDTPTDTDLLDDATEQAAAAIETITFDRLAVWWAGEQTEFPLTPADAPAEAPVGTATAAAEDSPTDPASEAPAGTPALAQDIAADGDPWHGILCPEGVLSGDARRFTEGAITWRDLPLPLMYQDATLPGHDGAVRVGRIDSIERDTSGAKPMIRATGVWDTSETAVEAARQVETRMLRGVSVDCDDVTVELTGSDGETLDPMVDDFPEDGVVIEEASAARISGATLCSIPAFVQAYVANGVRDPSAPEPGMDGVAEDAPAPNGVPDPTVQTVAASAWSLVASPAPHVTAAAFANPGLTEPTPLTIEGRRIYGHLAAWGVCHIGISGICQEAPASATNYAYFATGSVETEDGLVAVGQLTMDTGHAPMNLRAAPTVAHYDNTGTAIADVAMGEDGIGIWYAGLLRPSVTEEQVYAIRASGKVSGDWRDCGAGLELVAGLIVNVPGFPIPRTAMAASAGRVQAMVASGIVDRPKTPAGSLRLAALDPGEYRAFLSELTATLDRRDRARAATARLRRSRVAAAVARIEKVGV